MPVFPGRQDSLQSACASSPSLALSPVTAWGVVYPSFVHLSVKTVLHWRGMSESNRHFLWEKSVKSTGLLHTSMPHVHRPSQRRCYEVVRTCTTGADEADLGSPHWCGTPELNRLLVKEV